MRHYDGTTWVPKEYKGWGNNTNLKHGTGGDQGGGVSTICNGSPFDTAYGSISLGSNSSPQADGQTMSTIEATPVNITLTGSDPVGNPFTYRAVTGPAHGSLSGTDPELTYTPNPNFYDLDGFTFVTNDGQVDSTPATVSRTVLPVNDSPMAQMSLSHHHQRTF